MEEIRWLIDQRVVLLTVSGTSGQAETAENMEMIRQKFDESTQIVHLIIDATDLVVKISPLQAKQFADSMKMLSAQNLSKMGWTLLISSNGFVRFVSSLFVQWMGAKMRLAPSVEAALTFLQEQDSSLPQLTSEEIAQKIASV